MGLFEAFVSFNFSELVNIGPDDSTGPSDKFSGDFRLLYFHTLTN